MRSRLGSRDAWNTSPNCVPDFRNVDLATAVASRSHTFGVGNVRAEEEISAEIGTPALSGGDSGERPAVPVGTSLASSLHFPCGAPSSVRTECGPRQSANAPMNWISKGAGRFARTNRSSSVLSVELVFAGLGFGVMGRCVSIE
jgi:hypothetical protein